MKATWRTTADEPASAQLRRLAQDCNHPSRGEAACERIDAALPALADLVASVEECCARNCRGAGTWRGVAFAACNCTHCRALATLREVLRAQHT